MYLLPSHLPLVPAMGPGTVLPLSRWPYHLPKLTSSFLSYIFFAITSFHFIFGLLPCTMMLRTSGHRTSHFLQNPICTKTMDDDASEVNQWCSRPQLILMKHTSPQKIIFLIIANFPYNRLKPQIGQRDRNRDQTTIPVLNDNL